MKQDRVIRNTIENLAYICDVLSVASKKWDRPSKDRAQVCTGDILKVINSLEAMENELETKKRMEQMEQVEEDSEI